MPEPPPPISLGTLHGISGSLTVILCQGPSLSLDSHPQGHMLHQATAYHHPFSVIVSPSQKVLFHGSPLGSQALEEHGAHFSDLFYSPQCWTRSRSPIATSGKDEQMSFKFNLEGSFCTSFKRANEGISSSSPKRTQGTSTKFPL